MLHFPEEDMLLESVRDFYQGIPLLKQDLTDLYEKLQDEDGLQLYRIKVHAIKSNLALLGYMQLSAVAKILEFAARDKNMERIHMLHPVLMEEMDALEDKLSPLMPQEEEKPLMTDVSWMQGVLSMLKISLEELDYDSADRTMEMLLANAYEEEVQKCINELKQLLINLENEKALQVIEELFALLGVV